MCLSEVQTHIPTFGCMCSSYIYAHDCFQVSCVLDSVRKLIILIVEIYHKNHLRHDNNDITLNCRPIQAHLQCPVCDAFVRMSMCTHISDYSHTTLSQASY